MGYDRKYFFPVMISIYKLLINNPQFFLLLFILNLNINPMQQFIFTDWFYQSAARTVKSNSGRSTSNHRNMGNIV